MPLPDHAPSKLYFPPPATPITNAEQAEDLHRINNRTSVDSIARHPIHSVLEFPETMLDHNMRIAHLFDVDPSSFRDPRLNIQYSLDVTGSKDDQHCCLLGFEDDGKGALCYKFTAKCE